MGMYLKHTDPNAFLDFAKCEPGHGLTKECPRCKGYGGWNLRINAYRLPPGVADTAANRHQHVHFRCVCNHCNGNGYVLPDNTCPGHKWKFTKNLGRSYNEYACTICGAKTDIDSGD